MIGGFLILQPSNWLDWENAMIKTHNRGRGQIILQQNFF